MNKLKLIKPALRHLLSVDHLSKENIQYIFERADYYLKNFIEQSDTKPLLQGKIITLLFFEPSTRTRHSFEVAAARLGATVIAPNINHSSVLKGESLIDTIHSLEAMGVDLFVLRHTDDNIASFVATELASTNTFLINAGDGINEHPTQTLIDLFTIAQHKKSFQDLVVALVGDVAHSRVARSLIKGLKIMGVKEVRVIAPSEFAPKDIEEGVSSISTDLHGGLKDSDIVYALRIQNERIKKESMIDLVRYTSEYCITQKAVSLAKDDALIMHPGPLNRGVEIESAVADSECSVIMQQVKNGVAIRMALLDLALL